MTTYRKVYWIFDEIVRMTPEQIERAMKVCKGRKRPQMISTVGMTNDELGIEFFPTAEDAFADEWKGA